MNPDFNNIEYAYPPADFKNPSIPLSLEFNAPGPEWAKLFRDHIATRTFETFNRLQFGGVFRGVAWSPKLGIGLKSPRLNYESGDMMREAISAGKVTGSSISWNMSLPYAHIWQEKRPYLFFDSSDIRHAESLGLNLLGNVASFLTESNDELT